MSQQTKSPLRAPPLRVAGESIDARSSELEYDELITPLALALFLVLLAALEAENTKLKKRGAPAQRPCLLDPARVQAAACPLHPTEPSHRNDRLEKVDAGQAGVRWRRTIFSAGDTDNAWCRRRGVLVQQQSVQGSNAGRLVRRLGITISFRSSVPIDPRQRVFLHHEQC